MKPRPIRRAAGQAFGFAALALFIFAFAWPTWVEHTFHSRLAVMFLALWCGGSAILLHPKLSATFAHGFHEFRRATNDVTREIRKAIGKDDDDND